VNVTLMLRLFKLSFKNLAYKKFRSFLTAFGIIIGIAAVITTYSISEGLRYYVKEQIAKLGANKIISHSQEITARDARLLKKHLPGISGISVHRTAYMTVKRGKTVIKNSNIVGVDGDYLKVIDPKMEHGRFILSNDMIESEKVGVIGARLADKFFPNRFPIGEHLTLISGRTSLDILIVGVREKLGRWKVDRGVEIPGTVMRHYLGSMEQSGFVISVKKNENVEDVLAQVKTLLAPLHDDVKLVTATEFIRLSQEITSKLTTAGIALAALCLLVGGIGLMNIMLVSVTERKREIGVKRAIGFRKQLILNQFLVESVSLCMVGGLFGFILGVCASKILSHFLTFDTIISLETALVAVVFSTAIGLFFGYSPAKAAANLQPVEALQE